MTDEKKKRLLEGVRRETEKYGFPTKKVEQTSSTKKVKS